MRNSQPRATNFGFVLICGLFLLSGFSSLIYQVVWTRLLVLVFGSTTFATATMLAVFMAGLALGSFAAGRLCDRIGRPFLWYGILEGIIGLWALLVPLLFDASIPLYRMIWQHFHLAILPFSLIRFLVAGIILILPTTCMGATLPLLAKFVTSSLDYVGRQVGSLYAVNTFGAVCGAALAGFCLLPGFGLTITTGLAAACNLVLFALVLVISPKLERKAANVTAESTAGKQKLPLPLRMVIVAFALSGAIAMIYEVCWTRTLSMVIGSSTYAFTIMLTTFLVGISLGSFVCARFIDRAREPLMWFVTAQFLVCMGCLLSMSLLNYLPWWTITSATTLKSNPQALVAVRFLLSAIILLPLTVSLGTIFPTVVKVCTADLSQVGRAVGTVYSANTLGAIFGSCLSGFLLVPFFGVERTLLLSCAANLIIAGALLCFATTLGKAKKSALLVLNSLAVFACFSQPMIWDKEALLSVQDIRRKLIVQTFPFKTFEDWLEDLHRNASVVFWKDGACSSVGVMRFSSGRSALYTNGCVDASDGVDMPNQVLLAAVPLLLKSGIDSTCVIGWGSGVTIGTITCFPVRSVSAIELEPAVLEASRFFHHVNHQPEKDQRVKQEFNDGRNFLLAADEKYDLILSEPSNPWQVGVCNLFTREYFHICRLRLNPEGTFALWLQTNEISPDIIKEILASLRKEFSQCLVFSADSSDLIVLASNSPFNLSWPHLKKWFAQEAVRDELISVGIVSPARFVSRIAATPAGIDRLVAGTQPNVDDTNQLEYVVGRTYETRTFTGDNRTLLEKASISPWQLISWGDTSAADRSAILAAIAQEALQFGRARGAYEWASAALQIAPNPQASELATTLRQFAAN